jgi:hypothetical protein
LKYVKSQAFQKIQKFNKVFSKFNFDTVTCIPPPQLKLKSKSWWILNSLDHDVFHQFKMHHCQFLVIMILRTYGFFVQVQFKLGWYYHFCCKYRLLCLAGMHLADSEIPMPAGCWPETACQGLGVQAHSLTWASYNDTTN